MSASADIAYAAPNLTLDPQARIGPGVALGANVVIHAGVVLAAGVVVQDGAVLGKRPKLSPTSGVAPVEDERLLVGEDAAICTQAIVFASARIGARTIIGDQAYVRERARVGSDTVVGRASAIDNDVVVGDRVRIQTNVYVTGYSVIEDDVFVGPCTTTTNDDTMNRHDERYTLRGVVLRRACRVGGGVVFTPGVEVAEEAFVAAGAVVTRDVPPRAVVMGSPARVVREVVDADLRGRRR